MQGKSQRELALYINKHYDPLRIAESIAQHEFFQSEPLIAVKDEEGSTFRIIEGNRRLTAILGLSNAALREEMAAENRGWLQLATALLPDTYPVLVVEDYTAIAPLLGFRHISGIEPWDPYAQARYIAQLVDSGTTLDEVADLVGKPGTQVRSMYRDYDILQQAEAEFHLDVSRARAAFGVFNNCMGRRAMQAYLGVPPPRSVDPEAWPMPGDKRENAGTLLTLVFGNSRGEGRVVRDSRQLKDLAKVLSDHSGRSLRVLLATHDLDEAVDAVSDPRDQLKRALSSAERQLRKVRALSLADGGLEEQQEQLRSIRNLAVQLYDEAVGG